MILYSVILYVKQCLQTIKKSFIGQFPNNYGQYDALVPCSFEDYEELVKYIYSNLTIEGKKVKVVCGYKYGNNKNLQITYRLVNVDKFDLTSLIDAL